MSLAQAQAEALKSIAASQQQVQQIPGAPVSENCHPSLTLSSGI